MTKLTPVILISATLNACGFINLDVLKAGADAYVQAKTGQPPPVQRSTPVAPAYVPTASSNGSDPKAAPVNYCLSLQAPRNSLDWQDVVNTCAFPVTFTYCLQGGTALFECKPGNYGVATDSVGAYGRSGMNWAETRSGSRPSGWVFTACRSDSPGDVIALRKPSKTGCY